jgi:integrase
MYGMDWHMKGLVEAHQVVKNGLSRWRVLVPAELNGGKTGKARYFKLKVDATDYARELQAERGRNVNELIYLEAADRSAIIRAFHRLGRNAERLEEAVDFFLRVRPVSSGKTVELVVEECLRIKEDSGKRHRYLQALKSTLGRFASEHKATPIENVTHAEIERWLGAHNWSLRTRKGYLIDLRTLFSYALKRGYVSINPAEAVEKPMPEEKPPGILTVAECARLLSTARQQYPGLVPFLAISLFAGLRASEAARIAWDQVKAEWIDIEAEDSKTRKRRLVPITPTLRAWLDLNGDLPVVNLTRRLRRVRKAAKVPWPHNAMRHSFCSYAVEAQGAKWTSAAAGHSEDMLFANYRERVTPNDAQEFWALRPAA